MSLNINNGNTIVDSGDGSTTVTRKYQIIQKLSGGNTLILHPETDAEVVKTGWYGNYLPDEFNYLENKIETAEMELEKKVSSSEKGQANGVASLDSTGKVPSSQLPSYVDDVVEYAAKSLFPATGETGKIYVDKTTNLTWRWSGSAYVEISPSLALGETSSTAYAGDKGAELKRMVDTHDQSIDNLDQGMNNFVSGYIAVGKAKALDHDVDIYIDSDTLTGSDEASNFSGTELHLSVDLKPSGITAGTYSCVSVDAYGRATAGAQIVEVGTTGQTAPSSTLAIGGIFFKEI